MAWEPEHINIYFTGNVQINGSPAGAAFGLTSDPAMADADGINPYIVINDSGFTTVSGDQGDDLPFAHTAEHEMCHFLARFDNRTFSVPSPSRTYDVNEHVGTGENNLLRDGGLPSPLVVPGRFDQVGTEKYQIWQRIITGQWPNP